MGLFYKLLLLGIVSSVIVEVGCSQVRHRPPQKADTSSYVEEGMASWYGGKFHGRRTASGERFNTHDMTCAHRTLPFGTRLKVTNLENQKEVEVRVNDRGPFIRLRIIDLSKAAAKALEFLGQGMARVRLQILE